MTAPATTERDENPSVPAPIDDPSVWRRFRTAWPTRWSGCAAICGGEAAFPLVILFGLNAVDELDRTAFGILLPDIRDAFGLDLRRPCSHRRAVVGRRARAAGADRPVRRPRRSGCRW